MSKKNASKKNSAGPKATRNTASAVVLTAQSPAAESPGGALAPRWHGSYALIPVALACVVFLNALWNGFATDDLAQVLNNAFIKDLGNIPRAFTTSVWAFVSGEIMFTVDSYFRPVFSVLFSLEHALFGSRAWGWHLTNVLIHAAATWLVFLVIRELTGQRCLSLATAVLFAVHPAHVESVAWVSGVTDPLMALFLLPSFYCYLRYRKEGRKRLLVIATGLYFLALLSKETALALPLIIVYCELFHFNEQKPLKERISPGLALAGWLALPTLAYFLVRYNAINTLLFGDPRYPLAYAVATTPLALVKYLGFMIVPAGYSYQHYTPFVEGLGELRFLAPLALLCVIAVAVVLSRSPRLRFGAFWFLATLAPALAALRQFDQEYLVQERYLYLPSIGFCLGAAAGVEWLASRRWAAPRAPVLATSLTCAITFVWGAACVLQNRVWRDNLSVYMKCVEEDPQSALARMSLSRAYYDAGRPVEAEREAQAGLSLDPGCAYGYLNLSYYAHRAGKKDKAIEHLERGMEAVKEGPLTRDNLATIHLNLALIYADMKDYAQAEKNLLRSNEIAPRAVGWYQAGNFYLERGRYEEARNMYELTLRKTPKWFAPIHVKLGQVYDFTGQTDRAREEYRKYLELAPPNATERANVAKRLAQL